MRLRKIKQFLTLFTVLFTIFILNYAGGDSGGNGRGSKKIEQPVSCDETELDATLTFGLYGVSFPFQYPSAYQTWCGTGGQPYSTANNGYQFVNSAATEAEITSDYYGTKYYCKVVVEAVCPYGSTNWKREYLWTAGSSLPIKIMKNLPVKITVTYIDEPAICMAQYFSGQRKRVKWVAQYDNGPSGLNNLSTDVRVAPYFNSIF